jgi:hypothetical protein
MLCQRHVVAWVPLTGACLAVRLPAALGRSHHAAGALDTEVLRHWQRPISKRLSSIIPGP